MSSPLVTMYTNVFKSAYDATLKAAEGVAEENRLKQIQDGKAHPLWFIGHVANTNNLLVNMWCCEGTPLLPKEYQKMFSPDFAGGSPPTSDASFYPSWDEVLDSYKKVGQACVDGIAGLTDEELNGELRGGAPDAMKEMFGNVANTIQRMSDHDAYHRGQMMLINALK